MIKMFDNYDYDIIIMFDNYVIDKNVSACFCMHACMCECVWMCA